MSSGAKIQDVAKQYRHLRITYHDAQRTLGELCDRELELQPKHYDAVRYLFEDDLTKTKKHVPLKCAGCGCRVQHVRSVVRPQYFAALFEDSQHAPPCEVVQTEVGISSGSRAVPRPDGTYFIIGETEPARPSQRTQVAHPLANEASVGSSGAPHRGSGPSAVAEPQPTRLGAAEELLDRALNTVIPRGSVVRYRGVEYALIRARQAAQLEEGELVAVYGHFAMASWNAEYGRLMLKAATGARFHVWASTKVTERLLELSPGAAVVVPDIKSQNRIAFLAFGMLTEGKSVRLIRLRHSSLLTTKPPLVIRAAASEASPSDVAQPSVQTHAPMAAVAASDSAPVGLASFANERMIGGPTRPVVTLTSSIRNTTRPGEAAAHESEVMKTPRTSTSSRQSPQTPPSTVFSPAHCERRQTSDSPSPSRIKVATTPKRLFARALARLGSWWTWLRRPDIDRQT